MSAVVCGSLADRDARAEGVNFGRDVLPILSDNCLACHGADESNRKAKLRLDTREGATRSHRDRAAVVPGKPAASALVARITSADPDELMPPLDSHKKLTPAQIQTLTRWIAEGAPWGTHWAFERPRRPAVPVIARHPHPIDALVIDRLRREGLSPSPPAPPTALVRRVSFDLTGLPPTPKAVDAFVADRRPDAYARLVDTLLTSPHFGERMAMWWLDAARYADTDGFQVDAERTNWPWRDWVVEAFNRNMPFDRFTIEQFAGDLLPHATSEQRLATAFHRHHMTNGEGGRDPEESRVDYVIDRVNTVGTVWLGLTVGCAQCHTHKYDPILHADYYGLAAFFDSIDEDGKAGRGAKPYLPYQSPHAARAIAEAQRLVDQRAPREARARQAAGAPFVSWLAAQTTARRGNVSGWQALRATALAATEGSHLVQDADGVVHVDGPNPNQDDYQLVARTSFPRVTGLKLEVLPHPSHTNGSYSRGKSGFFTLTDIKVQVQRTGSAQVREIAVASAVADVVDDPKKHGGYGAVKDTLDDDPRNGWSTRDSDPQGTRTAQFALAEPLVLAADESLMVELRHRSTAGDANIGRFRISITDRRGPMLASLSTRSTREDLFAEFLADHAPYLAAKAPLERAQRALAEIKAARKVDVMVLAERPEARKTHILLRGVWDKKGEEVQPHVPAALAPDLEAQPRTRLGLAEWLVGRNQPLTSRVVANHLWQLCFGTGLVSTPEDFGLQGGRPSHPELLDWLAVELVESGWDIKHLLRTIVTSETYRQRSAISPALLARDPDNRLLARGPRFRLPSWMLRDAALADSGLLNPALGGPPVRPYQPEGVWEELFMGRLHYVPSEGPAQYRRTLYAFWRRSIAPTFLFDTAQRRTCEVRTSRTNTPLQALTLLNDVGFLEAARELGARAMRGSPDRRRRLLDLGRRVLGRTLDADELAVITRQLEQARTYYRTHVSDARAFLKVGQSEAPAALDPSELAAHTVVASLLLNLDEAITHE